MPWTKVQPLLTQRWQWPKGLTETSHFWNLIFGEFDEPNFRGGSLLVHRKVNKKPPLKILRERFQECSQLAKRFVISRERYIIGGCCQQFSTSLYGWIGCGTQTDQKKFKKFHLSEISPKNLELAYLQQKNDETTGFRDPCVGSFGVSNMMEHDEHVRTKHHWLVVWNIVYFPQ